jgi:hypothetical protein
MRIIPALIVVVALGACTAGARSTEEISNIQADCSNVDIEIGALEQEKIENNNRAAAGVGSVMPVSAVARMVKGSYKTNTQIATGEWGKLVDAKLAELRYLQQQCRNQPFDHSRHSRGPLGRGTL